MKVKRKQFRYLTPLERREAIVAAWQSLGKPAILAHELLTIQQPLQESFGDNHIISPASIARELAQAGAELRHPEIIECDAHWREAEITSRLKQFKTISALQADDPLRLNQAESLIAKLERLRKRFEQAGNDGALAELKGLAIEARTRASSRVKDGALDASVREEQSEIAEWLIVWLQTPRLFSEWLELPQGSPAF